MLTVAVFVALTFIFYAFIGIDIRDSSAEDIVAQLQNVDQTRFAIGELIMNVILSPLLAGLVMLAINTVRNNGISLFQVFAYISYILPLGVAFVLINLAVSLGFALFVIPGFYLLMATTFALPLIVDKGVTPFSAIVLSVRMVNAYLFPFTILFLIFVALLFGVIISFGFALIWVGPFYYNVKAVLYQDLFCGQEEDKQRTENDPSQSGVFDA